MKIKSVLSEAMKSIKAATESVESELKELHSQRWQLEQKLISLRNTPRAKEDIIQAIEGWCTEHRAQFLDRLAQRMYAADQHHLTFASSGGQSLQTKDMVARFNPLALASAPKAVEPGELRQHYQIERESQGIVDADNLIGLLMPQLKEAMIAAVIELPSWPEGAKLPAAEREKQIGATTKQIADVNAKINQLVKEAREAGLDV